MTRLEIPSIFQPPSSSRNHHHRSRYHLAHHLPPCQTTPSSARPLPRAARPAANPPPGVRRQSVEAHAREQATALSLLRARLGAAEAERAEWRRRCDERAGEEAAMAEQLRAALEQRTALMQASLQARNRP